MTISFIVALPLAYSTIPKESIPVPTGDERKSRSKIAQRDIADSRHQ